MEWRQNRHFSMINISNSQIEKLFSSSRSTNVNVNMSFPNSNFEGIFSTYVYGKSFYIMERRILIVGHRDIYYAKKILKTFLFVEVGILVEMWIGYESHIFPRPLLQTCRLETTFLCLNTRLLENKNFQILIIYIEINLNLCLLCAHDVMTCTIIHTRRPNCQ